MGGKIMEIFLNVVPILGIVALIFAAALAAKVNKQDAGTERRSEERRVGKECM